MDKVQLTLDGKIINLPIITGTEDEKGIDVTQLRSETNHITFDPSYGNTGSCSSEITYINGEKGILRYRGYPIEQLANNSSFVEVIYLLLYGELPSKEELDSQLLYSEPKGLNIDTGLPKMKKEKFKQGVYY